MNTVETNHFGPGPDLAAMLSSLTQTQDGADDASQSRRRRQNTDIVEARLGVASGLFAALRAKHEATAQHCLRVALGCSAWSLLMDMSPEDRDALEIAALLHDVGKIGVPDSILLKPSKLQGPELAAMERQKVISQQILASCCASAAVLEIVHYAGVWYDGTGQSSDLTGPDLPLGARVLQIVDAYDSMTTDHVYRKAMTRERVMAELYGGAGSQFDPDLVNEFCSLTEADRIRLDESVGSRWLEELRPTNGIWAPGPQLVGHEEQSSLLFHEKLVDSMHDAVVFVNNYGVIERWNRAATRMSGVSEEGGGWSNLVPRVD